MQEEIIGDWVKVFETPLLMEAELNEAGLRDEGIEYQTKNKMDIGYTTEIGEYWTLNAGNLIKIFVKHKDVEKALKLITEDRSSLLDNPDLDFGKTEN